MLNKIKKILKKSKTIIMIFHGIIELKSLLRYSVSNFFHYVRLKILFIDKPIFKQNNKQKVFLMIHKYFNNTDVLSNENFIVLNTLKNTYGKEIDIEVYYYDADYDGTFTSNINLINKIILFQPTYLIISSYSGYSISQPPIASLKFLKQQLPYIKFINLMWDTASYKAFKNKKLLYLMDVNIIGEGSETYLEYKDKFNFIKLFSPQDSEISYLDPNVEKDIDVLFLGSTGSYRSNRNIYLDFLLENNVRLIKSGGIGNDTTPMSAFDYAKLTQRAKIIINFSHTSDCKHHIKGRVFEALHADCFLLESDNNITSNYFIDGKDYISYKSKEELLKKIEYYLNNHIEREHIAMNGYKKVINKYSEKVFWETIFHYLEDEQ